MQASSFGRPVRIAAAQAFALILAGIFVSAYSTAATPGATPAVPTGAVHSLSEFDFLIGDWTCRNTEAGKPDVRASVQFGWMYDKKVLKEVVTAPGYSGEFLTTLDKKTNTFKGVAVDSFGGYIVWENPGMKNKVSSEVGYLFADGRLIPVSRSDFERVSDTHYVIRDFGPDTDAGKGRATDTEDCTKNPSALAGR